MADIIRIDELLKLTLDELYLSVGIELDDGLGVLPKSSDKLIKNAKDWLKQKQKNLIDTICNNEQIKSFNQQKGKQTEIITTIIDMITSIYTNVSPITIAVIIYKEGIDSICKDQW